MLVAVTAAALAVFYGAVAMSSLSEHRRERRIDRIVAERRISLQRRFGPRPA